MSKTIVTGANGFIGSHLVKRLNGSLSILDHEEIIHGVRFDAERMFFLSTYGNMAHHDDAAETIKANVVDLLTVTKFFAGWFCFMSSSSVLLPIQTPYSRTKRSAEEILQSLPNLRSCIVRPYSVFGVGEQKEHLIPRLIHSCMTGEEMNFTPWPIHDWIDVEDVVDALMMLSDNGSTGIYEIGTGRGRTNQDVLDVVESVTGAKANVRYVTKAREYDTRRWICNLDSATYGWSPKRKFEDTIEEMVEHYKNEHA